jgi:ribosomal protein L7/L12
MKNFADTQETAATITRAANGWVANSRWDGPSYIATSLHELATLVEGPASDKEEDDVPAYSAYAPGFSVNDLHMVKQSAAAGHKIDAIKLLRRCFTARLNLREAKELVEVLCG